MTNNPNGIFNTQSSNNYYSNNFNGNAQYGAYNSNSVTDDDYDRAQQAALYNDAPVTPNALNEYPPRSGIYRAQGVYNPNGVTGDDYDRLMEALNNGGDMPVPAPSNAVTNDAAVNDDDLPRTGVTVFIDNLTVDGLNVIHNGALAQSSTAKNSGTLTNVSNFANTEPPPAAKTCEYQPAYSKCCGCELINPITGACIGNDTCSDHRIHRSYNCTNYPAHNLCCNQDKSDCDVVPIAPDNQNKS